MTPRATTIRAIGWRLESSACSDLSQFADCRSGFGHRIVHANGGGGVADDFADHQHDLRRLDSDRGRTSLFPARTARRFHRRHFRSPQAHPRHGNLDGCGGSVARGRSDRPPDDAVAVADSNPGVVAWRRCRGSGVARDFPGSSPKGSSAPGAGGSAASNSTSLAPSDRDWAG